jgi:hypothetical protein
VRDDAARLKRPGSTVRCVDIGETVVVVLEPYLLPTSDAFVPAELQALAFIVPVSYPDAQPDASGFYVLPTDLKVASTNALPRSANPTELMGKQWLKFSWGPKGSPWDSSTDTLETYLSNVERRFLKGD